MTRIQLRLFGGFQIMCGQEASRSLSTDKERGLLAYLVLEAGDRPVRRELLCELLWDGYTRETARHSLRNALYNLRKLFAPRDLIQATRLAMQFDVSHPEFWCDVLAFQALIREADHVSPSLQRARYEKAASLYRGEFLEGLRLWDCPKFNEWQARQQVRLAEQAELLARSLTASAYEIQSTRRRGRLPRSLTPFFGRESELEILAARVAHPAYPLITITGEGGIGKTRLALALAEQVQDHFADGVWFVSFVDARTPQASPDILQGSTADEVLTTAIGEALSLTTGPTLKRGQLFHALQDRAMLLILDNFERIENDGGFIVELLQACPRVSLVVTSRKRLNLQAELVFRLHGLPVPAEPASAAASGGAALPDDQASSVRLFAERANRIESEFSLTHENTRDVIRICRAVEGLPLAIELAAALVDRLSCAVLAAAVEAGCDVLATTMRDIPSHHRSLRVVFDTSWEMLSDAEARALARCTVFEGGFSADAALAVAQTTPAVLQALVDKSLLRQNALFRYDMHEVVRQFSSDRLSLLDGEPATSQAAHGAYYAAFLGEREERLVDEPAVNRETVEEFLNIRAAWRWAARTLDLTALTRMAHGLAQVCYLRGLPNEATSAFELAANALHSTSATSPESQRVRGRILVEQAFFTERLGRFEEATAQAEEAIAIGQQLADRRIEASGHLRLASVKWAQDDHAETRRASERGLAIAEQLGDARLLTIGFTGIGNVLDSEGDMAGALVWHEKALDVALRGRQRRLASIIATNIGNQYLAKGDPSKAKELFVQALAIGREMQAPRSIAIARRGFCRLLLALGDSRQALVEGEEAQRIFEEIGEVVSLQRMPLYLALAHYWCGGNDTALHLLERTLGRESEGVGRHHRMAAFVVCSWIHVDQGHPDLAIAACTQAITLGEQTPRLREVDVAHCTIAQIVLNLGDLPTALEHITVTLPALEALPFDPVLDPFTAYLASYRVLSRAGDDRADAVLGRGWQRLQEIASAIADEADRHRFLYGIPMHRELAELATAR